jgi:hypothetical protein
MLANRNSVSRLVQLMKLDARADHDFVLTYEQGIATLSPRRTLKTSRRPLS